MLCTGWRTDNARLMDIRRSFSRKWDINVEDMASHKESKQMTQCEVNGRSLAHALGRYMATCCFDDNVCSRHNYIFDPLSM